MIILTAVVGILNKDAVAIAADSAVTISGSNGTKITNGANKIFRLSKYQPVGVMIYNSASFMGTPWETIIKLYRKHLGNNFFDSLDDYTTDFIEYLKSQEYFTNEGTIKYYVTEQLESGLMEIIPSSVKDELMASKITEERRPEILTLIKESAAQLQSVWSKIAKVAEFKTFDRGEYDIELKELTDAILDSWFTDEGFDLSDDFREQLHTTLHIYICSEKADGAYTGLIFTGFGDTDLYPHLIPLNISFCYDRRLHYFVDEKKRAEIKYPNQGVIRPFAQKDVMDTILSGIDPDLERTFTLNIWRFLDKFKTEVISALGEGNEEIKEAVQSVETRNMVESILKSHIEIKRKKYLKPLVAAVASLSKPDLAEMAESLIYLTYLKRRITFAEESVGGPVDVAIISKGDGFIWIKRKHYFDPKLNQHFFDNYYNM